LIAESGREGLTLVTTEKDIARLRGAEGIAVSLREIAAFAVTLEFDDAAKLRKFVAEQLFKAREKTYQARN
jgi:tetraacyldisaccharide 4'-kinase